MGDLRDSLSPPANHSRPMAVREDCWTEEATSTLVDAWGRRYLQLNRGNLRQKDWQDVADAVNVLHGHTKKTHRTDVQCKNRIDTIKKKYKSEKNRVSSPNGSPSAWPFFDRLDILIGPALSAKRASSLPSVALPLPSRKTPSPASAVPATALALPQKRSAAALLEDGYFRRNYSAMAAAAAAAEADDDEEEEEEEGDDEDEERVSEVEEGEREKGGVRMLAKAIERFGEVYERMEREKLRQMVDLEKQRMQFTKDLEVQRMQMFMETQVQLGRVKRGKRSGSNDILQESIFTS
ncbi:trihelix transcription factor ENAP2-like isoform X2 [Prosopis cineraria]|uniref:trihelix transcription factor ENAP2-like isoform X2 n=1 Tax=Prosopis cineraria TaxID=364024 RepID=UPI00240EFE83|nr:trihelix transcription factor ENAP2-like isoform X2 [Prosopis cineraria]XP_054801622.1 trihelix transcription factor ENAP2-like isoform X2 [Prosopis cineraria]XP_054801623.1 trihelix transcription factor ENAP2-like isoform X2 [Prosopis cineraria]